MSGRIVVFGATGYTGGLIARHLHDAGADPVLAGRDAARLEELAARLGGRVQVARADVLRPNSVHALVGEGDVLVSLVGPFAKHGEVAVNAAVQAGAAYLDSTGEPAFIRRVFEHHGPRAQATGAALLTALGYDFAPGALAGALALDRAGPAAARVEVGYHVFGASTASAGTKESLVGATLDPGFARRGGRVVTERGGARVRRFRVRGKDRPAVSAGGAEHFTLPAAYPHVREVDVFLGVGRLARAAQALGLATAVAGKVPGARPLMGAVGERLVGLAPARTGDDAGSGRTVVVAEALDAGGTLLASAQLEGPDPYDFTARFLAWAAQRAARGELTGTGALSPVTAFGLDALREGAAQAGLAEAAVPARG